MKETIDEKTMKLLERAFTEGFFAGYNFSNMPANTDHDLITDWKVSRLYKELTND